MREDSPAVLIAQFYAERNREHPLVASVTTVGSAPDCSLRVRDPRVADHHVRLLRTEEGYELEAVASDRPTRLDGTLLEPGARRPLEPGARMDLSDLSFRFTRGDAEAVEARLAVLRGVHRGKVFRLEEEDVPVGRATSNGVQFPDRTVSRLHCRLHRDDDGTWWVEDLGSTNGTYLNGVRVHSSERLDRGDEVALGYSRFVFQPDAGEIREMAPERGAECN